MLKRYFAVAAVWAVMVGHPIAVWAHGVGSREVDPGAAKAMEFLYADGEPMAFAQVQVTAPGEGGLFQSARADARGRFAFVPAGPGVWTVAASDGQGHRAVREVAVEAAQQPDGKAPAAAPGVQDAIGPDWRSIVLGLSLLANVALGAALARGGRRRQSSRM